MLNRITFNNLLCGFACAVLAFALNAPPIQAQCNTPYFKISNRKAIANINIGVEKIADFNGDGKPDIAGLDRINGNFVVLLNDGTGNFGNPVTTFVGLNPTSLYVGDLNGDGKKDLVVRRNTNPISITTFTGNGNGTFTQWNTTTFNQFDINIYEQAVKFDNDARPEILAGGFYYPINSDGTVAAGNPIFEASNGLLGDFNGDGKTDYVKNFIATSQPYTNLYLNNGNATFSPTTIATPAIVPLKAADLNNDGKDDLISSNTTGDILTIFLSSSSGAFTRVDTSPANFASIPSVGDFNGDGFKDIIVYSVDSYTVYFGSATGAFTQTAVERPIYNADPNADFDGDGKDDFIAAAPGYYFSTTSFVVKKNVCAVPGQTGSVDFDGDGRTDLALWRPSDGRWSLNSSQTNGTTLVSWGLGSLGDVPTPGDYDGDGKTDIAVWRNTNGYWYIRRSSDSTAQYQQWGTTGDKPVQGDYDGDGLMDVAVYRPSTGVWYIRQSSTGQLSAAQFGIATDKPIPADYDGDGKTDIAVYRPSTGVWYVLKSSNNQFYARQFGIAEDKPTVGDYDGDGKADIAVFRPSTGTWYLTSSVTGGYVGFPFGVSTDIATPINFLNNSTQVAVYRPSQGRWYISIGSGGYYELDFGASDEIPVSSLPRIE